MNKLVEEYLKNGKEIERIKAETEAKEKQILKERDNLLDEIYERRKKLDAEDSVVRHDADSKKAAVNADEATQIEPLINQRAAVKQIIAFLEVAEDFKPVADIGTEMMMGERDKDKFYEWQDIIYSDDFLKIRLLIAENDKPVNKYSVLAYGRCAFGESLIIHSYDYGTHLSDSYLDFKIRAALGSFKTTEEAKVYIEKKKTVMFKDKIEQVKALEKEYAEVTTAYKLSDFAELFEYHCRDYNCHAKFKTPQKHTKEIQTGYKDGVYSHEIVECKSENGWRREVIS